MIATTTSLDALKSSGTVVVADTGDFTALGAFKAQDATTNPTLILNASKVPACAKLIQVAVDYAKAKGGDLSTQSENAMDCLLVQFGKELLSVVPGRVSTEIDAAFSFDTEGTVAKARQIIDLYAEIGIPKERVLIKIASTWEGIRAAKILEAEGIACNLTLMFSMVQAIACAEAGVTLVSPFAARILDWYRSVHGKEFPADGNPGVESVRNIYNYYKKHDYKTIVMGASFKRAGEVKALAGCDYLTINPVVLKELHDSTEEVPVQLSAEAAQSLDTPKRSYLEDESAFRWDLFSDRMAFEKLYEGIRGFAADGETLKATLRGMLR